MESSVAASASYNGGTTGSTFIQMSSLHFQQRPSFTSVNENTPSTTTPTTQSDVLGKGGFGLVRKAIYQGQEVAVKSLQVNHKTMDPLRALFEPSSFSQKKRPICEMSLTLE